MPIRVLFAGQNFNFVDSLIERLTVHPDFTVKTDQWQGHDQHDEQKSRELLEWADVIICNWMLGNAVWYSQHKRPGQKLLIRYHRFEITTQYPKRLRLENVDKVISASPVFQPQIERLLQLPKEKSMYIYNPIDVRKFQQEKLAGSQFQLGMVGYNRKLKGLHRAITVWEQLVQLDQRYTLLLKGHKPQEISWVWRDPEEHAYFLEQFARMEASPYRQNIIFVPFGNDVPSFLRQVGFVISASDFESFHCAAAEGMAAGSIPLIAGWPGAGTIYPARYIFTDLSQMADYVYTLGAQPQLLAERQREVQRYAAERFDVEHIVQQFVEAMA